MKDVSKIKIQGSICSLDRYMQYLLIKALYLSTETEFSIYEAFPHHCPSVEIKEDKNGSLTNGVVLIVIFTLTYYWCQRELLLATGPIFFGFPQQGRVNDIDGRERTISTSPPNSPSPWQCLMVFEVKSLCSKLFFKGAGLKKICLNLCKFTSW